MNVFYFIEGLFCGIVFSVVFVGVLLYKFNVGFEELQCVRELNITKSG